MGSKPRGLTSPVAPHLADLAGSSQSQSLFATPDDLDDVSCRQGCRLLGSVDDPVDVEMSPEADVMERRSRGAA